MRHLSVLNFRGYLSAQRINDAEPAITTAKTPAHGSLCRIGVPVPKQFGVALAQQIIEFLSHGHSLQFGLEDLIFSVLATAFDVWMTSPTGRDALCRVAGHSPLIQPLESPDDCSA